MLSDRQRWEWRARGLTARLPHTRQKLAELCLHLLWRLLHPFAMPRQRPLEGELRERSHGARLLVPRMPTDVAPRVEAAERAAPPQMIAREEETVLNQQAQVAPSVAGRRNDHEIRGQLHRIKTVDHDFGAGLGRQLQPVNDARAGKSRGVFFRLGHIVAVGEKICAMPPRRSN